MAESRSGSSTPEVSPSPSSKSHSDTDLTKEEIVCPLCNDVFDTPRSLQCQHSYCEKCLMGLERASFTDKTSIKCPACSAQTTIPEEGIQGFPLNLEIQKFIEILSPEQRADLVQLVKLSMKTSASQESLEYKCTVHHGVPSEFFCGECSVLVCGKCMLNEHRLHKDVKYASDALLEHISSLESLLVPFDTLLPEAQGIVESLQRNVVKIRHSGNKATSIVKNYFRGIHQILTEREIEIHKAVKSEVTAKESTLSKQQNSIKETIDDLQTCTALIQDVSRSRRNDVSLLLDERLSRVKVEIHMDCLESHVTTSHQGVKVVFQKPFDFKPTFESLCKHLGEKKSKEKEILTDSKYQVSKNNRAHEIHRSSSSENISTQIFSYVGARHASLDSTCLPLLQRRSSSLELLPTFTDVENSLILSPFLEIGAKELRGSCKLSGPVYPYGVCFGKPDCLIVTDSRNRTFSILTPTGKCLESIALDKKGEGHSRELRTVTRDDDGNILIVDAGTNSVIRKYSPAGKYLSRMKAHSLTSGNCIGDPTGIAVLDNGSILVTDAEKSCIHCFDEAGKYQGKLNTTESHRPKNPADIAYDRERQSIIITDRGSHCVFVFTAGGQYLRVFGRRGYNPGNLLYPGGVTTDSEGNIFVAERGNHRISVFSAQGKFLTTFGDKGSEPGMFSHPRHMCMDPQGRLVVADECNKRIQIFNVKELLQQFS